MTEPTRIHIFQAYGVELEYMIVDRDTLSIRPITDELLKHLLGSYESDYVNGRVTWSNELVLHVVELKSSKPDNEFIGLEAAFAENILQINKVLGQWNAMLMPSAAHPLMDPLKETQLWPHENNEVYAIYNRIFDCKGHGWSNLQSMHLNLPFYDDEEFAKLHAAIRVVLPLLPALCASSPILDGKATGLHDTRLKYYKTNQSRLPSITGKVIPEAVFSKRNYLNTIYERIKADIAPFDPEGDLNPVWVNSRGAIPRFDRGSIEIRVMDIQECPHADLAIASLVIAVIKALASERLVDREAQMRWKTDALAEILDRTIVEAGDAIIDNAEYLEMFGLHQAAATGAELWKHLLQWVVASGDNSLTTFNDAYSTILDKGTLAKRLLSQLGAEPSSDALVRTYRQLADCLATNKLYDPQ